MGATMDVIGIDELLQKLSQQFSKAKVDRVVNKALNTEADTENEELRSSLNSAYHDTGLSADGVTHGKVSRSSGYPVIKMGNGGEHWRLIHLNEWGYTKDGTYHPGVGHGIMTKFIEERKGDYLNRITNGLGELIDG